MRGIVPSFRIAGHIRKAKNEKMNRKIGLIVMPMVMLAAALQSLADTWTDENGVTWTYRINGDTAAIVRNGDESTISHFASGLISIPSNINGCLVTRIDDMAFSLLSNVSGVVIPESILCIGERSFEFCSGMTSFTIPNSVTTIGARAFWFCSGLKMVSVGSCVNDIGEEAFYGCSALTSFEVSSDNPYYSSRSGFLCDKSGMALICCPPGFSSATVPAGVTSICENAFSGCSQLMRITVPDGVREIGDNAFANCRSLTSLRIPDGVENIGAYAFWNIGVSSVEIPPSVTNIGDAAFSKCANLASVWLPIFSEGKFHLSGIFRDCSSELTITYYNDVKNPVKTVRFVPDGTVGNATTNGYQWTYVVTNGCAVISPEYAWRKAVTPSPDGDLSVPSTLNGLTVIGFGENAFSDCSRLTSITIPSTVMTIGASAFSSCTSLQSITIPTSVTYIGPSAFFFCRNLSSIELPPNVEVGGGAFTGCYGLASNDFVVVRGILYDYIGESERITIPSTVSSIPAPICTPGHLTAVMIPPSVTNVGQYVFNHCYMLETVYLPNSCSVDESAFEDCSAKVYVYAPTQTVTFDVADGTVAPRSISVAFNSPYGNLPTPEREYFSFVGWLFNSTSITSDTYVRALSDHVLTAQWKGNQYTVNFDGNGGTVFGYHTMATVEFGSPYDYVFPDAMNVYRMGYTLSGWGLDGRAITESTIVTTPSNHTLLASWIANKYTARFDANGGNVAVASKSVTYDATYGDLPVPAYEGHEFLGWMFNGNLVMGGDIVQTASPHTLVAQWQPNSYSIFFDSNGGVLDYAELTRTYGDEYGELPVPTWEEHVFNGWELDGSPITAKTIVDVPSNHTLRATWSEIVMLPPLNDNFADADDFGAASGLSGTNSNATAEEGEPLTNRWENATTTVWWKWTAPEDGTATFDTVGSSFDTVMGVYVGESLGNLSVVAEDDDGVGAGNSSVVTFQATSGTTYHICVAGYRGATGDITINRNFSAVAKPQPPSPVVSLSATEDGPGVIRVSWGAPAETTATGYKVYRATRPNFDKAMLVTVLSDKWSLSYDDTDVSVDPTYYYWISAFNDVGESEVAGPVIGYCEEPLQIETSSLPVATELVEYETAILPEYDSGHLNWHVEYDEYGNPMLPDGLDMSSDGIISGCPTQAGTYTFTVSCCDTRFGVSVSKELTLTVAENPNRKPVVTAAEPVLGTDVVISNGTSQLFKVTASDPDGKGITYRWVVDGEEVSSGTQNSYRLRTSEDEPGTSHEVVCYVNDDLWTDFVACRWTVYVPNELHVSTDDGEWALINAIWDSAPYDTIHVAPGTYSADIWIQHPLTIVATDGPLQTKLEGTIEFNTDERALGKIAVLRGFTLTEYGYHKGYSDLSLERCIVAESGGGWEHWYEDEYDEEEDSEDVQERGILLHCTLTRCTIAANVADPEVLPLMVGCEYGGDTVIWGNEGAENDASDPMFVDAANGDYRLRTISPHVIDGTATKGALDEVVDGFVISASVVGVGALDKMTAVVSPGGSATFAVATGSHPLDHFEVNGNSVSGIGNAYTFSNVLSDATLTAVFVSNVTFYVDAANGNDVNDGFTKASAVATLQEAVNRAVDGDTVRVADGTYEPVFTDAKHIVIESANGYKTTVIDGGGTNGCVNVGYNPSGSFPPTISTNTVIRGFTLTNGRAFHGGGIIGGIAERCLVRNCVAFNEGPGHSAAFVYGEGGGAYCSTLRYCTIVENTAEFWPGYEWECDPYTTGGEGGGTYACTLEHCIVWNNTAEVTPDDDGSLCYVTCFEDPGFVDISNGDMRIDATSPWVVAGRATVGCEPDVEITSKPAQPQWNDVTCGNATDGVHLSWTGAGDQASYWVIYRADEEEYGYERLAHVDEPTYVDTTAVQDVHYWYWVEGYNKKGRSEESELAEGWCVAPLSVPDLAMPTGTVGRGYSVEFVAAGGNGEGCWWEQIGRGYDVERVNDTGHFMEDRGEETAIGGEYVLPFDFPVCDTSIRSVTIGDGNLSGGMENGLGWIELYPYWSQNDDFTLWVEWDRCAVRSQPDGVCFTWWTHYSYETWLEVTLYADGRIRYRYSGAAARGQVVPQLYMFHEDDIGNGYEFRPWPDCAEIVTSGTGYLFVPQSDGDLPPGISCDDDGFSGVPETNGVWAVRMRVHDWLHPDAVWSDAVFDIAIEKPQPYHPESEHYDDFVLWLEENGLLSSADSATEDDVYEAATKTEPGGKPFWHDFVTGTNPLETNDVFHATISIENGEVEVSWSPQLPAAEAAKRVYTIYGSTELPSSGDAEWTPIPDGTDKSAYRFFKVGVEMR